MTKFNPCIKELYFIMLKYGGNIVNAAKVGDTCYLTVEYIAIRQNYNDDSVFRDIFVLSPEQSQIYIVSTDGITTRMIDQEIRPLRFSI